MLIDLQTSMNYLKQTFLKETCPFLFILKISQGFVAQYIPVRLMKMPHMARGPSQGEPSAALSFSKVQKQQQLPVASIFI